MRLTPRVETVRVVAADDSAIMRRLLARLFATGTEEDAPGTRVELCGVAADGATCVRLVEVLQPAIVVLDHEMPGLSGLETIAALRKRWPALPIIMCSAYTANGAAVTLEALARGATDYVTKPSGQRDATAAVDTLRRQLLPKIVALAKRSGGVSVETEPQTLSAVVRSPPQRSTLPRRQDEASVQIVGIGVSTGGPAALEALLPMLPATFSVPVVIVQHMPKLFTSALAERLNRCCALRVSLGYHGADLTPGTVWLAPGDRHMEVVAGHGGVPRLVLHDAPPVNHCRPAVDPLFRSLAQVYGAAALGVVLTGMGSDGLDGAREIVAAGGSILAQNEATSAVWGMPGRIAGAGIAAGVLPLEGIAEEMIARAADRGSYVEPVLAVMHRNRAPEAAHGLL